MLDQRTEDGKFDWLRCLFEASLRVRVPRVVRPALAIAVDGTEMKECHFDFGIGRASGEGMKRKRARVSSSGSRNVLRAGGRVNRYTSVEAHRYWSRLRTLQGGVDDGRAKQSGHDLVCSTRPHVCTSPDDAYR